jgi:hypothetical protein
MEHSKSIAAVYLTHEAAEEAVRKLVSADFDMSHLSVVGKGFHTEDKVVGFYNFGDRIRFWGSRGAFWGGFWGLFFGGLFLTVPVVGQVVVLGYLAATIVSMVEGAVVVGGLSAVGAALYGLGVPKDSVIEYESALKADGFLVMVRGTEADIARAGAILATAKPARVDTHEAVPDAVPAHAAD